MPKMARVVQMRPIYQNKGENVFVVIMSIKENQVLSIFKLQYEITRA